MPFSRSPSRKRAWQCIVLLVALLASTGAAIRPVAALDSASYPEDMSAVPAEVLGQVAVEMEAALRRRVDSDKLVLGREALEDGPVSDAAVATYLRQADAAGVLARHALDLVGSERFAGIALDIPGQRIELFLAGSDFDVVSAVLAARLPSQVVVTKVDVSLVELRAVHEQVVRHMAELRAEGVRIVSVHEDVRANKLVVGVASDLLQAKERLHQAFRQFSDRLSVEPGVAMRSAAMACTSRRACPHTTTTTGTTSGLPTGPSDEPLRGGVNIQHSVTRYVFFEKVYRCTSAFAGRRNSDRALVVLTAGHCFDQGDTIDHADMPIGKVDRTRVGGASGVDGAAIKLENTVKTRWVPNNWIYTDGNTQHEIRSVYARDTFMGHVVDAPIAKEGDSTNTTVGRILETGATKIVNEGYEDEMTLRNATLARLCAVGGDSGGPVYWGNTGHGIVSAANHDTITNECTDDPLVLFSILSDVERELDVQVYGSLLI